MSARHPSDFGLDRRSPEPEAHVASCADCRARIEKNTEVRAAFLEERAPRVLAAVRQRVDRRRRLRWVWSLGVPAMAVGALLLFLVPRTGPSNPYTLPSGIK